MRLSSPDAILASSFGSLLLFSLATACGGDSPAPEGSSSLDGGPGGTTLADGAVVLPDGAIVPPPGSDGSTGGGDSGPPPGPGASGCKALVVTAGAQVEGSNADTFAWSDADCLPRTASLFRNDATDAFGEKGGYLRVLTYQADGKTRTAKGTGTNGWQGFGYVVTHFGSGAFETQGTPGTYRTVLAGTHHAIHEFKWTISPGGSVDVTAHWFFATGRSHPLFSVTFDATKAGPNTVNADTRTPYGDLAFDDGAKGNVDGVGWGDKYRFKTTGAGPVTPTSPWDYTQSNVVPYDVEWANGADAEMGLVQTQTFEAKVGGGDYGGGAVMSLWGKSGTNLLNDVKDWEWPFQLCQYELPFGTTSHRVAWGANYGAVGQSSYQAFGKTLSGYPFQSYAVYVVLGKHTTSAVDAQAAEIEGLQAVTLGATRGTVAVDGPAGVGRTDKGPFTPKGFDPVYGAWTVDAASNAATVQFGGGKLRNPVVVLRGYTASAPPSKVTLGGKTLVADVDYFATVDAAGSRLWITLNQVIAGGELTID